MQRWFGRMAEAIERHGGTVENYIGDAVMAVFGIPVAHEDDALRAVRAAADMREEVAVLRGELRRERGVELAVRIGVNTGEAVTGTPPPGGFFTAGDIVNVARAARAVGAPRRHPARARHLPPGPSCGGRRAGAPLTVKGKQRGARGLSAALGRARRARATAAAARADGRPRARAPAAARRLRPGDRRALVPALHRPRRRRRGQVAPRRRGHRLPRWCGDVAVGRCLPYGDGLTWWPLVEALGDQWTARAVAADDAGRPRARRRAAQAHGRAGRARGGLLGGAQVARGHRARPPAGPRHRRPALGRAGVHGFPGARGRLGARRAAAAAGHGASRAARRPARAGAPADRTRSRSCWSRWPSGGGRPAAPPAGHGAARPAGPSARILDVAEGNPLFVEEVVAMLIDDGVLLAGDGRAPGELTAIAVPPTIQALLAARLDRLDRASARSSRRRRSRARSSRASAWRRSWTTPSAPRSAPTCGRSSARTSSGPWAPATDLPLPPPAHPRRGLRRDAQGAARRAARALRGLAGGTAAVSRGRRAARLPPRARRPAASRARRDRRGHGGACGAGVGAPRRRRPARRPARRSVGRERAARARDRPRPSPTTWRAERCSRRSGPRSSRRAA